MSLPVEVNELLGLLAVRLGEGKHVTERSALSPYDSAEVRFSSPDCVYVYLGLDRRVVTSFQVRLAIVSRDFHALWSDSEPVEGDQDLSDDED